MWPTLTKVMASCLMAPSQYPSQRWHIINNAPVPLLRILSANQYELAFVAHRTAPYWFELLRISSLPLSYWFAGQYDFFEMFKTFVLALRIEAYSYCFVLHRRTSYQFVSVPIGSYLIVVHSYRFVVHSHWDSPPVCCDSVRCNTMPNDRIVILGSHMIALVRVSSY